MKTLVQKIYNIGMLIISYKPMLNRLDNGSEGYKPALGFFLSLFALCLAASMISIPVSMHMHAKDTFQLAVSLVIPGVVMLLAVLSGEIFVFFVGVIPDFIADAMYKICSSIFMAPFRWMERYLKIRPV